MRGHHGLTVLRIIGTIWAFWRGFFAKVVENFAAFNNIVFFAANTNYSIGWHWGWIGEAPYLAVKVFPQLFNALAFRANYGTCLGFVDNITNFKGGLLFSAGILWVCEEKLRKGYVQGLITKFRFINKANTRGFPRILDIWFLQKFAHLKYILYNGIDNS